MELLKIFSFWFFVSSADKLPFPDQFTRFGHLLSCGQNEVGQLGFDENVSERTRPALVPSAKDAKIVDISAGGMHSVYLTLDGDVWSFGCNDEGALGRDTSEDGSEYECRMVKLPEKCIRVTAGDSHSAFLLNDGRVFACGSFRDSHGTMGLNIKGKQQFPIDVVPNEVFVDIKSGADHLVMLSNKGKVFTVGCAEQGQLGRISTRSSSGETRRGKTELLKPGLLPTLKLGFIDAIWTTTYWYDPHIIRLHSLRIDLMAFLEFFILFICSTFVRKRSSTQIFAFGLNNYHQLGIKTKTSEALFTPQLTPFTNVKSIAGGQHHTLVLTNDNKCFAIGRKDYGRLGLGDVEGEDVDTLTPIQALNNFNVAQLDCGEACSFAVLDNGSCVYCHNNMIVSNYKCFVCLFRPNLQLGHWIEFTIGHWQ